MTERSIRIFISSPGDVQEERDLAKAVVEQLRKTFAGRLNLTAVLWEEIPLTADMSFQQGIDLVLSKDGIDVAVFILWSRLGTPTGPLMVGDRQRRFRSGTEREWHLMLQAREQCQRQGIPPRPEIIVYTRKDDDSFEQRQRGKPDHEKKAAVDQKIAVNEFIVEEFRDRETGINLRAYHSFDQPATFAKNLRNHLTQLLDAISGEVTDRLVWDPSEKGPPFRGLDVFEFQHSPIFFGREDEIVAIRSQLREQAARGGAFLLICGPSGSGKSSLARAGVLPDLCAHELDNDGRSWRWLAVKPSELGDDLFAGFLQKVTAADVLPELLSWSEDLVLPPEPGDSRDWVSRVTLRVKDALKKAGEGGMRLVVLIDQLEELFSQKRGLEEEVQGFFELLESLARSRMVWVVATVRSDFYQECQAIPALRRLKGGLGLFDLTPPGPEDLIRVITRPATLAGLRFERDGEKSLSDVILSEAAVQGELLPLVEHLLLDLYDHRTADGVLTFARYQEIQGLQGALRQHCERSFARLSAGAQAAFGRVLSQVVHLGGDNLDAAVRRSVPIESFRADSDAFELVEKLVTARLLTTGADLEGNPLVTVAHEAILRVWPRVAAWIDENRENLKRRGRLEVAEARWREEPDSSLLLQHGLPLKEGKTMLETASDLLAPSTIDYVEKSMAFDEAGRARRRRNLVLTLGALAVAVLLALGWVRGSLRQSRVDGLIANLIESDPERLVENIEKINSDFEAAEPQLRLMATADAKGDDDRRSQLHSRMALVTRDAEWVDEVTESYLSGRIHYLLPTRELLRPQSAAASKRLTEILKDPKSETEKRFRAAVVLAEYQPDPSEGLWDRQTIDFVAKQLIASNPEYQPIYRTGLQKIKGRLLDPLTVLFSDPMVKETERLGAANALIDFAAEDRVRLAKLVSDATPEQYAIVYPVFSKVAADDAIGELQRILAEMPPEGLGFEERVKLGQRRANAAVTLLRLGKWEQAIGVFDWKDDPEAMTQFIFRCQPRGVGVEVLLDLLDRVGAGPIENYPRDTRYAIILAIGEYDASEIPDAKREALVERLSQWYASDPNSGVHGAAGWLLRRLGENQIVEKVDRTPVDYSPGREWFTLMIEVQPELETKGFNDSVLNLGFLRENKPTKKFFMTFVVFPAGEYTIGSMERQPNRDDERQYRVQLTRPFAILDREITVQELIEQDAGFVTLFFVDYKCHVTDAAFGLHWYQSVIYCRWLGEQLKFDDSRQSYASPWSLDQTKYKADPNDSVYGAPLNWPMDVSRMGFRLPTEAEWEIAARGGTQGEALVAFGFGSESKLLQQFAWFFENSEERMHAPKMLRPSHRGLFDMHGNAEEWIHDWYAFDNGKGNVSDPIGPTSGSSRVNRGGSLSSVATRCRSAFRGASEPTLRSAGVGLRPVLSLSGQVDPAEQGKLERAEPPDVGTEVASAEQRPEMP